MNAIMHVAKRGAISTVAVLPPQPAEVTARGGRASACPSAPWARRSPSSRCRPTSRSGNGGKLIVSRFPGGPEDPSLGARGAVYEVKTAWTRWHGSHAERSCAGGFLGATNVAVGGRGEIYVAELFGGKVSVLRHGDVSTVAELPNPAGVEYSDGKLYVSYDVFPPQRVRRTARSPRSGSATGHHCTTDQHRSGGVDR